MDKKLQSFIVALSNHAVRGILGVIVLGLCLQSMFSTNYSGAYEDENGVIQSGSLNIDDNPFLHLFIFIACLVLFTVLKRAFLWLRRLSLERFPKFSAAASKIEENDILRFLCLLTGIAGCIWIASTQFRPVSDPSKIYKIAMQWREYNFSSYAEGGYLFRYPFQAGIILFYYLLSFAFGMDNFIALQLVNAAALVLIYYLLAKLAKYYWPGKRYISVAVYLGVAAWLPFAFYTTYLYGILPGAACSLTAVYFVMRYLEVRKTWYMVLSALCMGAATVIKMNCIIYFIAIACFLVYDIIITSEWKIRLKSLFFIFLMIISISGCNQAVYYYAEQLSGYETPDGYVMTSWITMGLQDAPDGPGSYNGYIENVFREYEYDTKKVTEASLADIRKILKRFLENPLDEGLPFFAEKNAFQWNEPTFDSININRSRPSGAVPPETVKSIISGSAREKLTIGLNYVQTLILLSVLSYLMLCWKSRNLYEMFGGVIFIGGYLFHFFWESGRSYTMPYFVLLIPYAVKGFLEVVCRLEEFYNVPWNRSRFLQAAKSRKVIIKSVVSVICLLLFFAFSRKNLFDRTIALNDGERARAYYYQRLAGSKKETLDGYYTIAPFSDKELVLSDEGGRIVLSDGSTSKIAVTEQNGSVVFRFYGSEQVLAVAAEGSKLISYMDDNMNIYYDTQISASSQWRLEEAGEGCYYILMDEYALAYEPESKTVILEAYDEGDAQKWRLMKY